MHIKPKTPSMPNFESSNNDRLIEEWRKPIGHPCPPFVEIMEKRIETEKKEYRDALDRTIKSGRISHERRISVFSGGHHSSKPGSSQEYPFHYIKHKNSINVAKQIKSILVLVIVIIMVGVFLAPHTILGLFGVDIGSYWNLDILIKDVPRTIGIDNLGKQLNDTLDAVDVHSLELKIFDGINLERVKNGLSPLKWNENVAKVARMHSQEMAQNNYFEHEGLDCNGPDYRVTSYGIPHTMSGENIMTMPLIKEYWYESSSTSSYSSYSDSGGVITKRDFRSFDELVNDTVEGWMNSPSHKENILTKEYQESGIGIAIQNVPKDKITNMRSIPQVTVTISYPFGGTSCPSSKPPDQEATFYITQDFISNECSAGSTFCNGECWQSCPIGYTFVCTISGGICE